MLEAKSVHSNDSLRLFFDHPIDLNFWISILFTPILRGLDQDRDWAVDTASV